MGIYPDLCYPKVWSTSEEGCTLAREVFALRRFGGGFQFFATAVSFIVLLTVRWPLGLLVAVLGFAVAVGIACYRRRELFARLRGISALVAEETRELEERARVAVPLESPGDHENLARLSRQSDRHYTDNWRWVREKLLQRDAKKCVVCGKPIVLATSVAHHITAFSRGGATDFANLVSVCTTCHAKMHPWLQDGLNCYWIRRQRGQVWCWRCKKRIDNRRSEIRICSDCGWLYHLPDHACGCNWPGR